MATVSFWGGVGVIGSSKILVEQGGWRVLLDFGLDYTPGAGPFRAGVTPRPGRELHDRILTGLAPRIPHVYRTDFLEGTGLAGGADGQTALFITHAHLDHMGLTGFVDPDLPLYAGPETIRLVQALAESGDRVEGGVPAFRSLPAGESVEVGPLRVTRYEVDHDVAGASGYRVDTENGALAFTGDIRLHGRHPEKSLAFAQAVQGARALVIEGTTLSMGFRNPVRTEAEVDALFDEALERTPGLVMVSLYQRNVERVEAFVAAARRHGRRFLWPPAQARALSAWFGRAMAEWGDPAVSGDIHRHPEQFAIQLPGYEVPWMLDFDPGPGSLYVHANGEPLGAYDPLWDVLQEWLRMRRVPFWAIGTSGHASPEDLNRLVSIVHPDILFPLHSQEPDRLLPPPGVERWLPERGRYYDLGGRR
jgi:ribonuclease J